VWNCALTTSVHIVGRLTTSRLTLDTCGDQGERWDHGERLIGTCQEFGRKDKAISRHCDVSGWARHGWEEVIVQRHLHRCEAQCTRYKISADETVSCTRTGFIFACVAGSKTVWEKVLEKVLLHVPVFGLETFGHAIFILCTLPSCIE
jgi:hypothetical protein